MDPTLASAFAQFGYPALVSGVLLYIIISKLEKTSARLEALEKAIIGQDRALQEQRSETKEAMDEILSAIGGSRAGKR